MWTALRPVIIELVSSKKALATLSALIVILGSPVVGWFGYEIDPTKLALYVGAVAAYVVGQGFADHGATVAQKNAQVQAIAMLPGSLAKTAALHALAGISPDSTKTADTIVVPTTASGEIKS